MTKIVKSIVVVFKLFSAKHLFLFFSIDFKSTKQQKKDTKKPTPNKNADDTDVIDLVDDDLEL